MGRKREKREAKDRIGLGEKMPLKIPCLHNYAYTVISSYTYVAVQSLRHVRLFETPWTAVCQASLSFTISQSLLKFMSSCKPCHAGPPKMDRLQWRVLTKHAPLEEGMANHSSLLAARMP